MQIKDLVSYYINDSTKTIEVGFKLENDLDDEIREDIIELQECENFGYKFIKNNISEIKDLYDEEFFDDDDEFFEDEDENNNEFNNQEVASFLNEYYLIYPDKMPKPELF